MKKKIKLDFDPTLEFKLLGLSSHENDYRISWTLNQELGLKFSKGPDLEIPSKGKEGEEQLFSLFHYEDEDSMLIYKLISNRGSSGVLIPKLKNIDYFIQVYGDINRAELDNMIEKLRQTGVITAGFHLNPGDIKGAEKLLFD